MQQNIYTSPIYFSHFNEEKENSQKRVKNKIHGIMMNASKFEGKIRKLAASQSTTLEKKI